MRTVDSYISTIEKKARFLPPSLVKEVEDFIDFLLSKNKKTFSAKTDKNKKPKFSFKWEGALAEYKHKYTSVELQHKANEWRNS